MFKIGEYVTRKKYNHDIIFKIVDIKKDYVILHGVDLRLLADAKIDDLELATISKKKSINKVRELSLHNYFYIPGVILHFDSDEDYLKKCMDFYKNNKIKSFGYVFGESEYSKIILDKIEKYDPNIVVITGHDGYNKKNHKYRNSEYFIETVKKIRKKYKGLNEIIIIAGACQSDYVNLIKVGSNFASSPSKVNIHCLDPAIIATSLALSDFDKPIDLEKILKSTKYGFDGFGGIVTYGKLMRGIPRKDSN